MKFEAITPPNTNERQLAAIKQNCKQICALYAQAGQFFYRGASEGKLFFNTSLPDRNPTHTKRHLHDLAVEYMKKLGIVSHRGNSTFIQNTSTFDYGMEMYVVFPLDGFKYAWSRTCRDFWIDSPANKAELNRIFSSVQSFQSFYQYTTTDLADALRLKHEVLIQGNYYLYPFNLKADEYEYQVFSPKSTYNLGQLLKWIRNEDN